MQDLKLTCLISCSADTSVRLSQILMQDLKLTVAATVAKAPPKSDYHKS